MESIYKNLTTDELAKHLGQFLVSSWSYSAVSTFSRNPKAYEMQSVYGYRSKSSATTIAGNAYHEALQQYFNLFKAKESLPELVDLETIAYNYIEETDPRNWKLQKTTPSVEECITQASTTVSKLLQNFLKDISVYIDEIDEILDVEHYGKGIFVTINGVDIPLPLYYKVDLVVKLKSGKIVIIDHKSKQSYTPDEAVKLTNGKQAITYVKAYEEEKGIKVDEVWFIENKFSQNRDKSPQLIKFPLDMTSEDERRYYEVLLYEGLRALVHAVNDPDYVYIMNDSDNLVDLAEIHEFWTKTLLLEVEDFTGIDPTKTELIKQRLKKIKDTGIKTVNPKVIKQFRQNAAEFIQYDYSNKDMTEEEKIEHVLRRFGTIVKVAKIFNGYSSNTYLLQIDAGTKINSIQSHKLDLANALDVSTVRISKELTVYEGKAYLAVELSKKRERDLIFTKKDLVDMKIPIGRDNFEQVIHWDLNNHSTPHALVCGATGCLAADTNISVYFPHYKRPTKSKTIESLYKLKNGTPNHQTLIKNRDKKDVLVRCLNESTNEFTYTPFDVVYSGKKQCYKVTTSSGNIIETTNDHRFLTPSGWKKLSELKVGDNILYRPSVRDFTGKKKQLPIKDVFVKYHPKGRTRTIIDKTSKKTYTYFRIPLHHFIYEADKNNLTVEQYKELLNNYDGRELFFIPKGYQIDHIDGDRDNNAPSNLQMLSIDEHAKKTVETADGVFGHFRPNECQIVNIEPAKIQETYDICCNSENHNFVANGLVVHNSGKSVALKSIIEFSKLAGVNQIIILDPKFEFCRMGIKGKGVIIISEILDIEEALEKLVEEMNERVKSGREEKTLIIFDEFADAQSQGRKGKELDIMEMVEVGQQKVKGMFGETMVPKMKLQKVGSKNTLEENLRILLQKGRSVGFRIVAATQRASVKVITGDAKANFPVQICFRVPKAIDSKVVLDEEGAEALAGGGDGLIRSPEYPELVRFQAYWKP